MELIEHPMTLLSNLDDRNKSDKHDVSTRDGVHDRHLFIVVTEINTK